MSIGPMWIETHGCSVHSSDGSNFSSAGVSSAASAIGRQREEEAGREAEHPLHALFTSAPKKVTSETASSSVYASA